MMYSGGNSIAASLHRDQTNVAPKVGSAVRRVCQSPFRRSHSKSSIVRNILVYNVGTIGKGVQLTVQGRGRMGRLGGIAHRAR